MEEKRDLKNTPKVLGLDISTKTIGWSLFDIKTQELLELTHFSPVIKPKPEDKIEELLLKVVAFEEKLINYKNLGITKVVIEEPLLNSNNVYTIQTLLRFNSFVFKEIYNILEHFIFFRRKTMMKTNFTEFMFQFTQSTL